MRIRNDGGEESLEFLSVLVDLEKYYSFNNIQISIIIYYKFLVAKRVESEFVLDDDLKPNPHHP
jgi:hypothetical protein